MAVSDFYNARWPDFICILAHYKYVMMIMMMMMSCIQSVKATAAAIADALLC